MSARFYTYNNIGNPLNDGTWTYTWEKGRQLKSMSKSGTTASYKYNENGLRIQKTVNGVVTNYTLHGKNIVHMTQGSNELHFYYDASNKPAIVEYNGVKYVYVHNLQGDIVAILDSNGTAVVQYKYDAWGKPISKTGSMASTLGTVQPFRYRGYVYDEETGLYYLRSRFYCAHHGRMLNIDTFIEAITFSRLNLFAYCLNNPSNRFDPSGNASINAMTSPYLNSVYMSQYYVKSAHDYREIVIDGMVELGYQYEEVSVMSDMQLYECLVNEVANTMNYNTKKGSMRIPNDTKAMMLLQELVIYSSDYSANQRYYALDIANACLERYSKETGTNFGIPADKIALEIRLHYDIYTLLQKFSINEEHTRVTDIIPTEGNIFQKGIDALYSWGVK